MCTVTDIIVYRYLSFSATFSFLTILTFKLYHHDLRRILFSFWVCSISLLCFLGKPLRILHPNCCMILNFQFGRLSWTTYRVQLSNCQVITQIHVSVFYLVNMNIQTFPSLTCYDWHGSLEWFMYTFPRYLWSSSRIVIS